MKTKSNTLDCSSVRADVQVLLDDQPIALPKGSRSLPAIRSYVETLALQQQRVLYAFSIDGVPAASEAADWNQTSFCRIAAKSFSLEEMPVWLIEKALQQTNQAEARLQSAISLVLINEGHMACQFWWTLARDLKQPLLTLTLIPDQACGYPCSGAPVSQLRKWQLQQLGTILMQVDEACHAQDPMLLASALETRVIPWLANLKSNLDLLRETLLCGLSAAKTF